MFQCVNGKMGNMKKLVEWTIYPSHDGGDLNVRIIQSNNRIAEVNLTTGRAMLSDGQHGNQGFLKLSPSFGAVEVECPVDILDQIRSFTPQVGPVVIMGGSHGLVSC